MIVQFWTRANLSYCLYFHSDSEGINEDFPEGKYFLLIYSEKLALNKQIEVLDDPYFSFSRLKNSVDFNNL